MKFKTKEELNKKHSYPENTTHYVVEDCFDSFKERIEFFKKYRNQSNDFDDNFELQDLWNKHCKIRQKEAGINLPLSMLAFNDWLFDYCFGDVIQ